jgi:hypothetical protein
MTEFREYYRLRSFAYTTDGAFSYLWYGMRYTWMHSDHGGIR